MRPVVETDRLAIEPRWHRAAALAALLIGVGLCLAGLAREGFWLDEVYSASFSNLSCIGTVVAVLLYDVHPPLYYLQLNAWSLLGVGDWWLRLNSVFWATGTLLCVYFGTRRQFGARSALLALMACAVMGGDIYFAHELRMYAMETCVVVLCWIAANRLADNYRFRTAWPLIILLAALGAIHSASVIPASATLLYVFPAGGLRHDRSALRTWFAVVGVVVFTYLPWVVNSSLRNALGHTAGVSLHALAQTVGGWLIGYGDALPGAGPVLAACLLAAAGLLTALLVLPRLLRLIVCFLVWPLVFAAILCVLVQPIWLDRTFAFCAPFVAIALGAALGHWLSTRAARTPVRYVVLGLFAASLLAGARIAYLQAITPAKPDHYRELADYLAARVASGEVIYAPRYIDFWGINRYLVGPDWGSVLRFQDLQDLEALKRWRRLYAAFGPSRLDQLGILPHGRRLDGSQAPIFTGFTALPALPAITGEWLVSSEGEVLSAPADWHLCTDRYPAPIRFGRLELYHWSCAHPT